MELLAADAAGILLGDARQELQVVAASSEDAQPMELLQLQADEGPCLDCFQTVAPVSVPDLADTVGRWPGFVAAVSQRGAFPIGTRAADATARARDRSAEPAPSSTRPVAPH